MTAFLAVTDCCTSLSFWKMVFGATPWFVVLSSVCIVVSQFWGFGQIQKTCSTQQLELTIACRDIISQLTFSHKHESRLVEFGANF